MADQVEFVYSVQGADQGAQSVQALLTAMEQQAAAADGAKTSTEGFERAANDLTVQIEALREETELLRAGQVQQTNVLGGMISAASSAGTQFQTLLQRTQGLAGAVQTLVSATGSSNRTAGAIASLAGLGAQGASLGAIMGPGGALVGGLVGVGAGIVGLATAHRDARPEIEATTSALRDEASAADTARQSLADFLSSISTGRRAAGLAEEADRLASMADEITRLRSSTDTNDRLRAITLAEEYRAASADLDGRLAAIRAEEGENAANRTRSSGGGGRRERPRTIDDILGTGAATNADIRAMGDAADAAARDAESERAARERATAEAAALEEKERRQQELDALEDKRHQRKMQQIETEAEARRRYDEERRRRLEQETRILQDFGGTVGGVFAGAFEAAITGQESFDAALVKGTKQALVQYGTTMVAEGIGALLTGVGNTILNPPAAATKLAEGAGKIALGVGLGAAGAAIPTPGAAAAAPERPEARAPASSGDGTGALVINMNAPTVMGGTHSEVGRNFLRAQRAAVQRFGGSA